MTFTYDSPPFSNDKEPVHTPDGMSENQNSNMADIGK